MEIRLAVAASGSERMAHMSRAAVIFASPPRRVTSRPNRLDEKA
jgi:hypothetical protein